MKELSSNIRKYLDNREIFDTVEKNLKKYEDAYDGWMTEIKVKVRDLVESLAKNNGGYMPDPDKGKSTYGIYWLRLYLNEDDFTRLQIWFLHRNSFLWERGRGNRSQGCHAVHDT